MHTMASCLGYPRMGAARELKRALESYWSAAHTGQAADKALDTLLECGRTLRQRHWQAMHKAGLSCVPTNDFSLYDGVLDMAVCLGAVPERYRAIQDPWARYFAMARGLQDATHGVDVQALEMTKWFDTNYHYIVPEIEPGQKFVLDSQRLVAEVQEARALGLTPRPVVLGPVSFLLLAKRPRSASGSDTTPLAELQALLPAYVQLLAALQTAGAAWVQLDEPCLTLDLTALQQTAYRQALSALSASTQRPKLLLATYFGPLDANLPLAVQSGCEALHVDAVRGAEQLEGVLQALPATMHLALGVVDGRNIWRCDLRAAHAQVRRAVQTLGAARLQVSTSCSLLHVPVDLDSEVKLDAELRSWMAFAQQKLHEVVALAQTANQDTPSGYAFGESDAAQAARRASPRIHRSAVQQRLHAVTPAQLRRPTAFAERIKVQQKALQLPLFPTTTIGSFPQTADIRQARAAWRAGHSTLSQYENFLRDATARCIRDQETLGLDVLVHGEFERNDMVEYFGEQLQGFAFTEQGWVQSYGSRCVKPPILFGDVARPAPMTVRWAEYAQSLTARPVKGMLTGPVTILQWSFVRNDQPRSATCAQIALALRDEVQDLQEAGIALIQVDEPAIREGLPLRHADAWQSLPAPGPWSASVWPPLACADTTQIHTHMCYSEFHDISGRPSWPSTQMCCPLKPRAPRWSCLDAFKAGRLPQPRGPRRVRRACGAGAGRRQRCWTCLQRAAQVLPADRIVGEPRLRPEDPRLARGQRCTANTWWRQPTQRGSSSP